MQLTCIYCKVLTEILNNTEMNYVLQNFKDHKHFDMMQKFKNIGYIQWLPKRAIW